MKKLLSIALCILMIATLLPAVQPHAASAEETYTVTWLSDDGTLLTVTEVASGEVPVYPYELPTKGTESGYRFVFAEWSPNPVPATEDAAYTACFTSIELQPLNYGLYWDYSSGVLTIGGNGAMEDFYVYYSSSGTFSTPPWASVANQIIRINILDGVTSVGEKAFVGCESLNSISIADSVTSIRDSAFYGCTRLRSITMPCSINVSSGSFTDCSSPSSVHFTKGTGIWRTGSYSYMPWISTDSYGNYSLKTVVLDEGITNIGGYAFSNCAGLSSIQIPDSVTRIEAGAFYLCSGIQDVYYLGTQEQKEQTLGSQVLTSATWHYLPPQSIRLYAIPYKTTYELGEELDLTGARLQILYDEGIASTLNVTPEMVTGFDSSTLGIKELTITYKGLSTTFVLTVSHIPGEMVIENEVSPTCISEGSYDEVVYCTVCGEEISREHIVTPIDPSAHAPGEPVHENEVAPTFTEEGHYDEVVYCSLCEQELSRETIHIDQFPFEGTVVWNASDVKYRGSTPYVIANGSAQTPRFTVVCADGTVVDPENYDYEYRENTNAGTGYVFVTLKGDYIGDCRGHFKIYLPPTTATYVENTPYAIKITWNPVDGAAGYVIYRRAWSSTTNGWTEFKRWDNTTGTTYYDGHDDAHKVYAGTRYQYGVKAYFEQRTDPVTGALIGGNVGDNYNLGEVGPLKTTVRITARDLLTLTAGSNQLTAEWTASKNFTGYQIKYATDAGFTKNVKTVKIASPATSSTVLKSLNNGTLYYVTIRSYHEFEGMTYFGAWSNSLCVKPGSGMIVSPTHYRALLIGNNNYTSSPLYGCVNDVNAMAGMLNRLSMDYTGTVVKNARKATIIDQIRKTFAGATDSDVSLFYYSGHGVDAGGSGVNQGALVGVDGNIITMRELAAELSKFRGRIIVILDSCHSGAAIGKSQNADDVLDAFNDEVIEAFSGYYLETENPESGAKSGELKQSKFIVITAASITQSSLDGSFDGSGYRQGAFTAALIKGMGFAYPNGMYAVPLCFPADTNGDRKATLKELYTYAYNKAYSWTGSQRAQYYGNDNEVVFSR